MAIPTETERKVRQLDNDVQAIYDMLATIAGTQRRQGNRLDELAVRLDEVGIRLDGMDVRLDGVGVRLDGMNAKLDTIVDLLRGARPSDAE